MRRLLALLPLALRNAAFGDSLMTGRWYTEGVEDGLHLQSVVANNPDGTFVKTIRNGTDCQAISTWSRRARGRSTANVTSKRRKR